MKALLQRVSQAHVRVGERTVGAIERGFVVLLGVRDGDSRKDAEVLARKTANLRVFPDDEDRMNRSVQDVGGAVLVVSQFTLYADTRKGNRPSFVLAAQPDVARTLYEHYVDQLARIIGRERVRTGEFQARMQVELINDGPVTIELCSES